MYVCVYTHIDMRICTYSHQRQQIFIYIYTKYRHLYLCICIQIGEVQQLRAQIDEKVSALEHQIANAQVNYDTRHQ